MKLIYALAYGKPYFFHVAQEMINSVRRVGYTGELIVLTDRPWDFVGAKTVPVDVGDGLWKCALGKAVNMADYDKILFIDSDITAQKPIDPLFCKDRIAISGNWMPLSGCTGTNYFLMPVEKTANAMTLGICSGTFSFPGRMGEKFLADLEARWRSFDMEQLAPDLWAGQANIQLWDECALMSMCLRGEIEWEIYPRSAVIFPTVGGQGMNPYDRQKTILIHFVGTSGMFQQKEKTLEWMKESQNPMATPLVLEKIKAFIATGTPKSPLQTVTETMQGLAQLYKTLEKRVSQVESEQFQNKEEVLS